MIRAAKWTPRRRLVLTTAAVIVLWGEIVLLLGGPSSPTAGQLPAAGHVMDSTLSMLLPTGGRILVISDYCQACRSRQRAYVHYLQTHDRGYLLLVEENASHPFFRPRMKRAANESQIRYLSPTSLQALRIQYTPSYLRVDSTGVVTAEGPWDYGRYTAALNPANWMAGWKRLFQTM